jgi:hypothetical protein
MGGIGLAAVGEEKRGASDAEASEAMADSGEANKWNA